MEVGGWGQEEKEKEMIVKVYNILFQYIGNYAILIYIFQNHKVTHLVICGASHLK
jgi:hypothetical protein